jgi:hypothetical protein
MLGVVKFVPVPTEVPPVAAVYQSMVSPLPTLAERVTVPVPHLEAGTGDVGAAGAAVTVACTLVLLVEVQPPVVIFASA